MKEGYYTTLSGFEYKIEQRQCNNESLRFETVIITDDSKTADDTFSFDETTNQYIKVIDPKSVGDVSHYSISYFYKGYKVGRLGGRDNFITIFFDNKDKDLALELGFTAHDRTEYIKTVDVSEVEMKQEGPYSASRWY